MSKENDTKCPFYNKDKCAEHCDMTKMQLWENVNSQHECDDSWLCDIQSDLFYYNNDAGHYSYIAE